MFVSAVIRMEKSSFHSGFLEQAEIGGLRKFFEISTPFRSFSLRGVPHDNAKGRSIKSSKGRLSRFMECLEIR